MEGAHWHTFLILTKRPERWKRLTPSLPILKNLWLGVSVENQRNKSRIDILQQIPAAKRFISFEPILENVGQINFDGISWCIVGGETGPKYRPNGFDGNNKFVQWARDLRDQCQIARIPFFFKQMPGKLYIPKDLMIRQSPNGRSFIRRG
jgi:protein gp37